MDKHINTFCETPSENCTMNYCDENGCINRKRILTEPNIPGRLFIDGETVGIEGSKATAKVVRALQMEDTGKWKYYLENWVKPVDEKDLEKIHPAKN